MGMKAIFIIQIFTNRMVNLFEISPSYSHDHCRQFALLYNSRIGTATFTAVIGDRKV